MMREKKFTPDISPKRVVTLWDTAKAWEKAVQELAKSLPLKNFVAVVSLLGDYQATASQIQLHGTDVSL